MSLLGCKRLIEFKLGWINSYIEKVQNKKSMEKSKTCIFFHKNEEKLIKNGERRWTRLKSIARRYRHRVNKHNGRMEMVHC